ncbi:MAG: T9SS type A sorting domain-containing protein, partial [Bacteroidota bacterium]
HVYTQPGHYAVCLTVTNNCGTDTICDSLLVGTIATDPHLTSHFSLHPNPATDQVRISWPNPLTETAEIALRSTDGKLIWQGKVREALNIDTRALSTGLYFVEVRTDGISHTQKLLIRR